MNRRRLLEQLGAAGAVGTLAGCSAILSCGPGDPPIEDIVANPDEHVGSTVETAGNVESVSENGISLVVDDGTGTAELLAPTGYAYDTDIVSEGDCHTEDGSVQSQDNWENTDADIQVYAKQPGT
jgi:hypothetical protein